MRSFRLKLTCWFGMALFSLSFVVLLGFALETANNIRHSEKVDLKFVARSIDRELAANPFEDRLAAEVVQAIDAKLAFMDAEGYLAYAVVTRKGQLLHKSDDFVDDPSRFALRGKKHRLFWGIKGSENWHFVFRHLEGRHVIFVSNLRHVELVEKILVMFAVSLGIVLILAFGFGYLISGKITRPLQAIATVADQVGHGNLAARIPDPGTGDEVADLTQKLNDSFAQLQNSFARISQFSGDAAHELKTPLTAIRGHLEVALSRPRTPDEYQQAIASAIEDVAGLTAVINDLLLMVRSGSHLADCSPLPVDVSRTLADALEQIRLLADDKTIALSTQIQPDLHVSGVETLLRRLFGNLLHNAVKFSPPGTTVQVALEPADDRMIRLVVTDQGVGIAKEYQGKVFDRFFVVDSSHNTGTGLGLALVKWIAELHGGQVSCVSEPGRGTTFQVMLPESAA